MRQEQTLDGISVYYRELCTKSEDLMRDFDLQLTQSVTKKVLLLLFKELQLFTFGIRRKHGIDPVGHNGLETLFYYYLKLWLQLLICLSVYLIVFPTSFLLCNRWDKICDIMHCWTLIFSLSRYWHALPSTITFSCHWIYYKLYSIYYSR